MKINHKQKRAIFKILLYVSISIHFILVLINLIAFFVLPFTYCLINIPFWLFVLLITPIETFIFRLIFVGGDCPITDCENKIRQTLGMKTISGFIGHYIIKPFRKKKPHVSD